MENKTIYDTLVSIKNDIGKNNGTLTAVSYETLFKLIENLKLDIMSQPTKTTTKQRNSYCIKYANKVNKKKPILGYCDYLIENEQKVKQYYTDSYFAVELVEEDFINLEYCKDKKDLPDYPNVKRVMGKMFYLPEIYVCKHVSVKTLRNAIKVSEKEYISFAMPEHSSKTWLDKKLLDTTLTFINANNDEIIDIYIGASSNLVHIYRTNGSRAIICPVKPPKDYEND